MMKPSLLNKIFIKKTNVFYLIYILICVAKITFIPIKDLIGLGDIQHFYNLAQIPGFPFIDYWVEFPPISALLFEGLYWLSNENVNGFSLYFIILMNLVNFGNLILFQQIYKFTHYGDDEKFTSIFFIYTLILSVFPFSWWYFDSLPLLFLMLGLYFFLKDKHVQSIFWITIGTLTKLFPVLFFVIFIKKEIPQRKIILSVMIFCLLFVGTYSLLSWSNFEMTKASIVSQFNKGSWETIWALLDGNFHTGNFGPLWERLEPTLAYKSLGNPPIINSWVTLLVLGLIGLFFVVFSNVTTPENFIQLILFTFCIFFLWSPGWSPQWVLYIIPLIMLAGFEKKASFFLVFLLIFDNFLEWPIILGLQLLNYLPITIIIRTLIFIIISIITWRKIKKQPQLLAA